MNSLADLSMKDRKAIMDRILMLQSMPKNDVGVSFAFVYDIVSKMVGTTISLSMAKKDRRRWPKFVDGVKMLRMVTIEIAGNEDDHDYKVIASRLVRLVLAEMTSRNIQRTLWAVGDWLCNVSAVVDRALPGYRESGMLRDILLRDYSSWKHEDLED